MAEAASLKLKRLILSPEADADIAEILEYLDGIPLVPGERVTHELEKMMWAIAGNPWIGAVHSHATRLVGEEVRCRVMRPYRIFYRASGTVPEIIAILHAARDISTILANRFH